MPPKPADQSKGAAGKPTQKTTPLLQLPELALSPINGQHNPLNGGDTNGLDQQEEPADNLQAVLGMLVNDDDDPDDLKEFESLVGVACRRVTFKLVKGPLSVSMVLLLQHATGICFSLPCHAWGTHQLLGSADAVGISHSAFEIA